MSWLPSGCTCRFGGRKVQSSLLPSANCSSIRSLRPTTFWSFLSIPSINYYKNSVKPFCSKTLISWSFSTSSGKCANSIYFCRVWHILSIRQLDIFWRRWLRRIRYWTRNAWMPFGCFITWSAMKWLTLRSGSRKTGTHKYLTRSSVPLRKVIDVRLIKSA